MSLSPVVVTVAPTGAANADDAGPGRRNRPLATLGEARRRVRAALAQGHLDVTVELLDGVHRLTEPLRLDAADSGHDGHPVTWTAARGADPVISGAVPVTGWAPDDPATGVYRARVEPGSDSRQLYVDGALARRARIALPREHVTLTATGLTLDDPGLAWLAGLPDQGRVEFQATSAFTNRFAPVERITPAAVVMRQPAWDNNTYGYDTLQAPMRTPEYFMVNARSFLDEPGEWYLDPASGTLYYAPLPGQDLATARVELPRLESLLEVGGTYHDPARHLRFENLTFTGTTWLRPSSHDGYANQQTGAFIAGPQPHRPADAFDTCAVGCAGFEASRDGWFQVPGAVQVSAAEDVAFAGCTFVNLGSVALGIGNDANAHATGVGLGARRITVSGGVFTANAGGGITVGGVRPDAHHPGDPRMVNGDIVISDNRVFATAVDYLDHAGVFASYVTRLTIAHNLVADLPYSGIALGYGWGANDPGGSPDYLARGLYDFRPVYDTPTTMSDVHVVGNHVRDVVRAMSGGGALYTLSSIPGGVIEENYCENSGQYGVYFDEASRDLTVRNNVFVNTAGPWAHANVANGNRTGDLTLTGNHVTNPLVTGIADGRRGDVLRDNTTVTPETLPVEAARIIYDAGPSGDHRGPPDPGRPPFGVTVTADPPVLDAGETAVVTVTVRNLSERRASAVTVALVVPDGWQAERSGRPARCGLDSGASGTETWKVTAPASVRVPVGPAVVKAVVTGWADLAGAEVVRSLTMTALNPLTSLKSRGSVSSRFAEAGSRYAILIAGAGSPDEYGVVYRDGAAGPSAVVTARVTHLDATDPRAEAGVVLRDDLSGCSPGHAAMVATPGDGVVFRWDADGDGRLDTAGSVPDIGAPVWVRLVRLGDQVSGYYSRSGTTWIKVGPTADLTGVAHRQDAGLMAASRAGWFGFSDFSVRQA
uniref:NEW3 domain-containing protein n=1 Tax=Herbidospora sakaeratensis TaxID=564415 RepID=UPI000A620F00|nr:NEW3 domain-containing protein [Herbidospora sakaeratensis]